MRAKSETYNDENRVKHSVVEVNDIDYMSYCASLVKEIESLGGSLPESIQRDSYVKWIKISRYQKYLKIASRDNSLYLKVEIKMYLQ